MTSSSLTRGSGVRSIPRLIAALAGSLVLLTPAAVSAQQSIRGVVAQVETALPINRAALFLMGADGALYGSALSDSAGQFEIDVPLPGGYILRVHRVGYNATQSELVQVPANAVVEVRVNLRPNPLMLEPVTVYGESPQTRQLREFHMRRSQRRGYHFSRADFERLKATTVLHLVPEIPGYRYQGTSKNPWITLNDRRCPPAVYVDGFEWRLGFFDLIHGLPLDQVYGVEVFRRWGNVPVEFSGGRALCGVILIWTVAVMG